MSETLKLGLCVMKKQSSHVCLADRVGHGEFTAAQIINLVFILIFTPVLMAT
jgi:hypothetical protein